MSIRKDNIIVGHIPQPISEQCTAVLKSGGNIMVKVIGNPVNTKKWGIRVPCIYTVNGEKSLVQKIIARANLVNCFDYIR